MIHRFTKHAVLATPLFLLFATASPATARADDGCTHQVQGTLASTQVTGAACPSPIGLCTQGTMTGGLAGTFFYTATSLTVLPDGITGVFDGTIVLTTPTGVVTEHDHTIANLQTGQLSDVITILSGTRKWEGATGVVFLQGSFNFATGVGASTYEGVVTLVDD
jgi:hypothetical protein